MTLVTVTSLETNYDTTHAPGGPFRTTGGAEVLSVPGSG